jgi:hypothetical protein
VTSEIVAATSDLALSFWSHARGDRPGCWERSLVAWRSRLQLLRPARRHQRPVEVAEVALHFPAGPRRCVGSPARVRGRTRLTTLTRRSGGPPGPEHRD